MVAKRNCPKSVAGPPLLELNELLPEEEGENGVRSNAEVHRPEALRGV